MGQSCQICKLQKKLASISLIVSDFDGVHTPNSAIVDSEGYEQTIVNRSDGLGIKNWLHLGFEFVILSQDETGLARRRANKLGAEIIDGAQDKSSILQQFLERRPIASNFSYIGNDTNDLEAMEIATISFSVSDALPLVAAKSDLTTRLAGGYGAVREVLEIILWAKKGQCYRCFENSINPAK